MCTTGGGGGEYVGVHGLNRHSFNGSSRVEANKTLACCLHGERDNKSWALPFSVLNQTQCNNVCVTTLHAHISLFV